MQKWKNSNRKGAIKIPDKETIKGIQAAGLDPANPPKRKRGRPKGSKNAPGVAKQAITVLDPKTGIAVSNNSGAPIIGRIGDEKVSAFVQYHIDMMKMRMGVNKKDVPDLYNRFYRYLAYCAEKGIIPNNMNAYFAIGLVRQEVSAWHRGVAGTPEHKQFADDIMQFFASIHEQAGGENIVNPILSIYWSKAHDGMIEASKVEVINNDPLGEKRSAEQISEQYADILPDE